MKTIFLFLSLFISHFASGQTSDSVYSSNILQRIFVRDKFELPATDGWDIIMYSPDVFSYVSPDFRKEKMDLPSKMTGPTDLQVYSMIDGQDWNHQKYFSSLDSNLDRLCLTQHQIIEVCRRYRGLFSEDVATFMLFKSRRHYYVAGIMLVPSGFWIYADPLESEQVFNGSFNRLLVVPAP